jgi:glucan phosphoethanolaminetransferase (alkaline phosphatase superfamily)
LPRWVRAACRFTSNDRPTRRAVQLAVGAVTLVLALVLPAATWLRGWPIDGVLVAVTSVTESRVMAQYLFPASSTLDPRDPAASWHAVRRADGPASETVVFIVGETIRNDYLAECHGPDRVRPVASGALVACDVTAGSGGTDQSVPLLVSREMPGHRARVSDDATLMRALAQAGFETWRITAQAPAIAWPDAAHLVFANRQALDAALLPPPLARTLAGPARLKAVLLHANNAHDPYCARYVPASAPYPSHCANLGATPDAANLEQVNANYANAVDASIAFVDGVIGELDRHPEPAFLIFSPDHGENLLDDGRAIWGHARRHPARWIRTCPRSSGPTPPGGPRTRRSGRRFGLTWASR